MTGRMGVPMPGMGAGPSLSKIMFDKYDKDHGGTIDVSEFKNLLYDFGIQLSPEQLKFAISAIDKDGNGTISYPEFLQWWRQGDARFKGIQLTEEQLARRRQAADVFAHFDRDRSGVIDKAEFRGMYQLLKKHNLTNKSEEKCLQELDANGDGSLQLSEFIDWLESPPAGR